MVVPRHEAAKAISRAWAPGHEGGIPGLQSHAFRPEAAPDAALQRPEQELLCHSHPPVGQQCYRVHAVRGEHGAGVPGGGGPEAGAAGDTLLWPLVSQQEPASTMGGAGETSEETSGQVR